MCLFQNVQLIFVSPKKYQLKEDICELLQSKGITFTQTQDFEKAIGQADAIYITRIQSEYGGDEEPDSSIEKFYFKQEHLKLIGDDCVIMHPLPPTSGVRPCSR